MTRRKLNNPTRITDVVRQEGLVPFDDSAKDVAATKSVYNTTFDNQQLYDIQTEALDCRVKEMTVKNGHHSNGTEDEGPSIKRQAIDRTGSGVPKLAMPDAPILGNTYSSPAHTRKQEQIGRNSLLDHVPSAALEAHLNYFNLAPRNNNGFCNPGIPGIPNHLQITLAAAAATAATAMKLTGAVSPVNMGWNDQEKQDNPPFNFLPKPPSDEMLIQAPSLKDFHDALIKKARELRQAIDDYEKVVQSAHRKAIVVNRAPEPRPPATLVPGTLSNGLLPDNSPGTENSLLQQQVFTALQASPTSGALPPLSPQYSVTGAGTNLTPMPKRLLVPKRKRRLSNGSMSSRDSTNSRPVLENGAEITGDDESESRVFNKKNKKPAPRKRNDRKADAEMNFPDTSFEPETFVDANSVVQVRLSKDHPDIYLPREKYFEIIKKGETSATRVIRMLMKYYFNPTVLSKSSLSGIGQYKLVLDKTIIAAIKDFISRRYPKLKGSRLNLCMTDVCVQARRVQMNQQKRKGLLDTSCPDDQAPPQSLDSNGSPTDTTSSHEHDDDLNVTAPALPTALEQPLSPPTDDEPEGKLVIDPST